jgi:hypothetical protein
MNDSFDYIYNFYNFPGRYTYYYIGAGVKSWREKDNC